MHVFGDLGVFAAHDAGDADLLLAVADHQHVVVQFALLAVQGHEAFAVPRAPDYDLMAGDRVVIERVHGLAVLFHHVVGDVHQVVDGTDAAGAQALLHPFRGRAELDVLHDAGRVARAQVGVRDLHGNVIRSLLAVPSHRDDGRNERQAERGRRFPGNAQDAVAVHAVGGDLVFEDGVMQAQGRQGVVARLHVTAFREDVDAVFGSFGEEVAVKAEFFHGAHHARGRDAAQGAGFDDDAVFRHVAVVVARDLAAVQDDDHGLALRRVRGAGHDLQRFLRADVDLAHHQLVRVRMGLEFFDAAHHNAVQILIQTGEALHFGAGKGHFIKVFLVARA